MQEPGLDRHEWETEMSDLEDRLRDDPGNALLELDELLGRMVEANGGAGDELRDLTAAREITRKIGAAEDVDPGDIAFAVNAYREVYDDLLENDLGA
ncbi:MAG TPA: hypothetical protein VGL76_01220 [Gaiellaceae bacterium]|jgi:hypothetical protein